MSELSRMLLVSNGNATTVVDRLERDGLVTRSPSALDRRTVHVALTDAGFAAFEVLAAEHERALSGLLGHVDEDDLEAMTGILKRMGKR